MLNGVNKRQEDAALGTAAFAAPANKLLGPGQGPVRLLRVRGDEDQPGTQQSLAQATPLIKQQLTSAGADQRPDRGRQQGQEATGSSQTTCRAAYAMADCKGYKAPKTATTTATSAGTATTG